MLFYPHSRPLFFAGISLILAAIRVTLILKKTLEHTTTGGRR
jgi:hypothetical protein